MRASIVPFRTAFYVLLVTLISLSPGGTQSKYPETIAVLQTVTQGEMLAYLSYIAYARKALAENYPNIAHLFVSLESSEAIHARNFRRLLSDLGVEVKDEPKPNIRVGTTKENLKRATQTELQEIDERYPGFIERIKPENCEVAIRFLTYAWESEKQHRALIEKIQSGTGIFFGILSSRIEKTPNRYFVCQVCGSMVLSVPKEVCPICNSPVSNYREVERPK